MNFHGKHILITGASRGIGRACAQQFARLGGRVAVHYHTNRAAADATLQLLDGEGHMVVQADIANPDDVSHMIDAVAARYGKIDVLVNNAGIFEEHPLAEVTYAGWQAAWQRILATNLLGAANAAYCVVPHLIAAGGGRIINISSRTAFRGKPEAPAYAASKAGLNALTQNLALALAAHRIYVYALAPGVVETDMAGQDINSPAWRSICAQSPLNRVAQPEEVAYTVVFLASEGAEFLTGDIIDVNGASYLRT